MEVNILVKIKEFKCEPGLGQCKKGLLCRDTFNSDKSDIIRIYTCQDPINPGEKCGGLGGFNLNNDGDYIFDAAAYLDPGFNNCTLGYTCVDPTNINNNNAVCVRIGSLEVDDTSGNSLACQTSLIESSDNCGTSLLSSKKTSRGLSFTNYANATRHFNSWLEASTYDFYFKIIYNILN